MDFKDDIEVPLTNKTVETIDKTNENLIEEICNGLLSNTTFISYINIIANQIKAGNYSVFLMPQVQTLFNDRLSELAFSYHVDILELYVASLALSEEQKEIIFTKYLMYGITNLYLNSSNGLIIKNTCLLISYFISNKLIENIPYKFEEINARYNILIKDIASSSEKVSLEEAEELDGLIKLGAALVPHNYDNTVFMEDWVSMIVFGLDNQLLVARTLKSLSMLIYDLDGKNCGFISNDQIIEKIVDHAMGGEYQFAALEALRNYASLENEISLQVFNDRVLSKINEIQLTDSNTSKVYLAMLRNLVSTEFNDIVIFIITVILPNHFESIEYQSLHVKERFIDVLSNAIVASDEFIIPVLDYLPNYPMMALDMFELRRGEGLLYMSCACFLLLRWALSNDENEKAASVVSFFAESEGALDTIEEAMSREPTNEYLDRLFSIISKLKENDKDQ